MESDVVNSPNSKVTRLLAMLLVDGKARSEQIDLLTRAGFNSTEIGQVLGISPGRVRAANSKARSKKAAASDPT